MASEAKGRYLDGETLVSMKCNKARMDGFAEACKSCVTRRTMLSDGIGCDTDRNG